MSNRTTMDGNTAVAHVAYRVNEVCAIYPITPSSKMAKLADEGRERALENLGKHSSRARKCRAKAGRPGAGPWRVAMGSVDHQLSPRRRD